MIFLCSVSQPVVSVSYTVPIRWKAAKQHKYVRPSFCLIMGTYVTFSFIRRWNFFFRQLFSCVFFRRYFDMEIFFTNNFVRKYPTEFILHKYRITGSAAHGLAYKNVISDCRENFLLFFFFTWKKRKQCLYNTESETIVLFHYYSKVYSTVW